MTSTGLLLSFEGIDGCGKSTQLGLLHDRLLSMSIPTLALREPGGTHTSEAIRSILLDKQFDISPISEMLLFSAARAQLVNERIRPALENGMVVLLDRFYDSTTAYQGFGRQFIDIPTIEKLNTIATGGLTPDITFYFDLEVDAAFSRRSGEADRMEDAGRDFFDRVRSGYIHLAQHHKHRFRTLDSSRAMKVVQEEVWDHFQKLWTKK
jgi:dTMP kinase